MMQKARPWVLLVRYNHFPTAGVYFEKYLRRHFNLACLYIDGFSLLYQIGSRPLGSLGRFLVNEALQRHLKRIHLLNFDAVIVIDPVRIPMNFDILGVPSAYIAIDNSDKHLLEQVKRGRIQNYDYVFVTQKDLIYRYKENGCQRVEWLPPACDPDLHKHLRTDEIFDVCFVGSPSGARSPFVRQVQARLQNYKTSFGVSYLHDMVLRYNESRIVLNKSLFGDLNQRVFEVMSCGRMLLTDLIKNGLEDLFGLGDHLVTYDDLESLQESVDYYLRTTEERTRIALAGQREVLWKHTYENRVRQIGETMGLKIGEELGEGSPGLG